MPLPFVFGRIAGLSSSPPYPLLILVLKDWFIGINDHQLFIIFKLIHGALLLHGGGGWCEFRSSRKGLRKVFRWQMTSSHSCPLMSTPFLWLTGNTLRCRMESISESVVAGGLMGDRCCLTAEWFRRHIWLYLHKYVLANPLYSFVVEYFIVSHLPCCWILHSRKSRFCIGTQFFPIEAHHWEHLEKRGVPCFWWYSIALPVIAIGPMPSVLSILGTANWV